MTNITNNFNYSDNLSTVKIPEGSFVVDIQQQISNQNELYDVYKRTITLPNYFGNNWDAFLDAMLDLNWVPQKNLIIRHFFIPSLSDSELKIYLEILTDTINHWRKLGDHEVYVYFNTDFKEKIYKILSVSN